MTDGHLEQELERFSGEAAQRVIVRIDVADSLAFTLMNDVGGRNGRRRRKRSVHGLQKAATAGAGTVLGHDDDRIVPRRLVDVGHRAARARLALLTVAEVPGERDLAAANALG